MAEDALEDWMVPLDSDDDSEGNGADGASAESGKPKYTAAVRDPEWFWKEDSPRTSHDDPLLLLKFQADQLFWRKDYASCLSCAERVLADRTIKQSRQMCREWHDFAARCALHLRCEEKAIQHAIARKGFDNTGDVSGHRLLGEIYLTFGNPQEALVVLQHCTASKPSIGTFWVMLGRCYDALADMRPCAPLMAQACLIRATACLKASLNSASGMSAESLQKHIVDTEALAATWAGRVPEQCRGADQQAYDAVANELRTALPLEAEQVTEEQAAFEDEWFVSVAAPLPLNEDSVPDAEPEDKGPR